MSGAELNIVNDTLVLPAPLPLDGGQALERVEVAYETCGTLNADKSNAVVLFHALTMDQHVVGTHPKTGKPGWWAKSVGPGKVIDTDRYFIICANVLGGCMGSTGPASPAPDGQPYAMRFPVITIRDMVRAQVALLDALGIDQLHAVIGGSMGGMQALSFAANWPARTRAALVIASTARHSAQNIAFHEVGRQAIMADPKWKGGDYGGKGPENGLAVARMAAHITYLSEEGMHEKFGRKLQNREAGGDFRFAFESRVRRKRDGKQTRHLSVLLDAENLDAAAHVRKINPRAVRRKFQAGETELTFLVRFEDVRGDGVRSGFFDSV